MKALLWEKSGSALLSLRKLYTGTSKIENWKHFSQQCLDYETDCRSLVFMDLWM
jgi:hypothetical protein